MFLETISTVDQEEHTSTIEPPNIDDPMFYWTFRNMDFKWNDPSCSQVIWLSGPAERNIHQISAYIVNLEKKATLKPERIILYFFCSSTSRSKSIVDVFAHTLLHQIVCSLPTNKQLSIVKGFLYSLLEEAFQKGKAPSWRGRGFEAVDPSDEQRKKLLRLQADELWTALQPTLDSEQERESWKRRGFEEADPPGEQIKKLLEAPADELWTALQATLDCGQERELSLIVDGLDHVKDEKGELIRGVRAIVKHLQQRTSQTKILLSSRPQAEIKEVLGGFPCIEYDKERKG
jgi:ankyrin repeat domain-containing protein 50